MNNALPKSYNRLVRKTKTMGFTMASDHEIGKLLRTLVASKRKGRFLEIGTGTGLATSWLLDGMGQKSHLLSLDNDAVLLKVTHAFFGDDHRLDLRCVDGNAWIKENSEKRFDLIFADTWPGKFHLLKETLNMVEIGGFYIVDDLLPQQNWPKGHDEKVYHLIHYLNSRKDFFLSEIDGASGIILMTKK